jgi:RNA recognition motif-containing protein
MGRPFDAHLEMLILGRIDVNFSDFRQTFGLEPCICHFMKNKPSNTVYISNLSYKRDRNGLRSLFEPFGQIRHIKIIVEPTTNQSRGMAFVEMGSVEEATKAISGLNGKSIDGRTVKANYAIPQREEAKRPSSKKTEKDLEFKKVQLQKKARNDAKRKSKTFDFTGIAKKPVKKTPQKKSKPAKS